MHTRADEEVICLSIPLIYYLGQPNTFFDSKCLETKNGNQISNKIEYDGGATINQIKDIDNSEIPRALKAGFEEKIVIRRN